MMDTDDSFSSLQLTLPVVMQMENPYSVSSSRSHQPQHPSSSQSKDDVNDLLCILENNGNVQEYAVVINVLQKFCIPRSHQDRNDTTRTSTTWKVSQVLRFVEWLLIATKAYTNSKHNNYNNHHDQSIQNEFRTILWTTLVYLLQTGWREEDDRLIYAAVTFASEEPMSTNTTTTNTTNNTPGELPLQRRTLLQVLLLEITTSSSPSNHSGDTVPDNNNINNTNTNNDCFLLLALSLVYESLERLHLSVSSSSPNPCDPVWWLQATQISASYLTTLLQKSVQGVLQISSEKWDNPSKIDLMDYKIACVSLLTHFVSHGVSDWLHEESRIHRQQQEKPVSSLSSYTDWLSPTLFVEAIRLNDIQMPYSPNVLYSMQCLNLLLVFHQHGIAIDPRYDWQRYKKQFMSNLWYAIVSNTSCSISYIGDDNIHNNINNTIDWSNAPRWTHSGLIPVMVQRLALQILHRMVQCYPEDKDDANVHMEMLLEHSSCTQSVLKQYWKYWIHPDSNHTITTTTNTTTTPSFLTRTASTKQQQRYCLECLILLHRMCRTMARDTLKQALDEELKQSMLQLDEICVRFVYHLLECARDCVLASTLLQQLLMDKLDITSHDNLSRSIWDAILMKNIAKTNSCFATQCVQMIVEVATTNTSLLADYHRPVLLGLLDIAYILIRGGGDGGGNNQDCAITQSMLECLSVESIEALVNIVSSKEVHARATNCHNHLNDSGFSTPPVNNLSRLDDDDDDDVNFPNGNMLVEEERISRGIDPMVRMATATVLAALAASAVCTPSTTVSRLLCSRMKDAAMTLVADLQLSWTMITSSQRIDTAGPESLDMTRRRFRLLSILAASDNSEEYLVNLIHSENTAQNKVITDLLQRLTRSNASVQELSHKNELLRAEQNSNTSRWMAQRCVFQRETSTMQRNMTRNAKQSIEVHRIDREKAENKVHELTREMTHAQQKLKEYCEAQLKLETLLNEATKKLEAMSAQEKDLIRQTEQSESQFQTVTAELKATQISLDEVSVQANELRQVVSGQRECITNLEESESHLRESLESLFGDMVSLARLYEALEKKFCVTSDNEKSQLERLKRDLKLEQQRTAQLEEQEKRSQCEMEMLSRKYARMKEKLDKERDERRNEAERRMHKTQRSGLGTASYFNQLQTGERGRGEKGKENISSISSRSGISTQRR